MGLLDFLKRPAGPPRGWSNLPAIPEQKGITFNGAEYVPPLVSGPGASAILEAMGAGNRPDGNSAVFACLMALSMAFFEPAVKVFRTDREGKQNEIRNHPLRALLMHPNPFMSEREFWFWVSWALNADGNAYLEKVRAGDATGGNVVELWPRSPTLLEPVTARGSGDFITRYRLQVGQGRWREIPLENVVHMKLGIDDRDMRFGLAPIKRLIRHVASDDEASRFAGALLGNFGVPGLVVQTQDKAMSREDAEELKARISSAFGTDNRGNVGILSNGATMSQFGFSPEQLNLKALHQIPETRIAAVMRVPPAVADLSVGLEQTSAYASFEQVREKFVEGTLIPLWALRDDKLQSQLLPDFANDATVTVASDLTDVRALQADEDKKWKRLDDAVKTGWISKDEARSEVGLPPLPEGMGEISAPPDQLALPPGDGEPALRVVGGGG